MTNLRQTGRNFKRKIGKETSNKPQRNYKFEDAYFWDDIK